MAEALEQLTLPSLQFRDLDQQRETAEFGMWIFLVTEALLFGALFISYTVFRHYYYPTFADASRGLDGVIGTVNTIVLILSSVCIVIAIYGAQYNERYRLLIGLAAAIVLGMVFLALKGVEYYHHYQNHEFPGLSFDWTVPNAAHKQVFFFLYFMMTGVHAIHLIIGILLVAVVLIQSYRRVFTPDYYTPIENVGLYWHFVDVVWVFLYPLFYLIDLHK